MHGSIRGRVIATLGVLALVAAACDGGGATGAAAGEQAAGAPTTVEVKLSDFEISPSPIEVPVDVPISFSVMNMGQTDHTFALDANGTTYDTGSIDVGATVALDVPALDEGSYDAYCSVPGHEDLGMVATVIASVDAAGTGATGTGATGSAQMTSSDVNAFLRRDGLGRGKRSPRGQHLVKEPTETDGIRRYSCDSSQPA